MDHIDRPDVDADGTAGGDHQLVAGDQGRLRARRVDGSLLRGVLELEPPLVAGRGDLVGVLLFRLRHVVRVPDGSQRGHRDDDQREDRGTDQANLHQGVTVALGRGRRALVRLGPGPEPPHRVGEHAAHQNEDDERDPASDVEQVELRAGDRALGDHRRLVTIHPPEVEVAAREEQQGRERGKKTAAANEGGGDEAHWSCRRREGTGPTERKKSVGFAKEGAFQAPIKPGNAPRGLRGSSLHRRPPFPPSTAP